MAQVREQDYEVAPVASLLPHPENPRRGNVAAIAESIDANGFYGAVVAQRSTGYVLAGNHRLLAAEEAGIDELPVVWIDVDDDRARRILLADNRTNDLATYDRAALFDLLQTLSLEEEGLVGSGYNGLALAKLTPDFSEQAPESQPRLDAKSPVTCPACGNSFIPG